MTLIHLWALQAGDVIETGFGDTELLVDLGPDEEDRTVWKVRYLDLDIEMEHPLVDKVYKAVALSE